MKDVWSGNADTDKFWVKEAHRTNSDGSITIRLDAFNGPAHALEYARATLGPSAGIRGIAAGYATYSD